MHERLSRRDSAGRGSAVATVDLDQAWVADLTHIPRRVRALYLATGLDLGSRRCVGWATQATTEVELPLRPPDGLRDPAPLAWVAPLFRSWESVRLGRVSRGALRVRDRASTSPARDRYDNAVAERSFSTLEFELIQQHHWPMWEEERYAIFPYIEGWYNPRRRHSSLGYASPAAYEAQVRAAT